MTEDKQQGEETHLESQSENAAAASSVVDESAPASEDEEQSGSSAETEAQPEQTEPWDSSNPRWLGYLVGILGVTLPMILVFWLFYQYSGQETQAYGGAAKLITGVAFSPNGELVASSSADGKVRIYHRHSGKRIRTLSPNAGSVFCLAFSPDGEKLLTGDLGDARIWEVQTGKLLKRLESMRNNVICGAYSPNGKYVATSSRAEGKMGAGGKITEPEGIIRLWDVSEGQDIRQFGGYRRVVTSVAFSPDGKKLLGSDGNEVRLWDVASGKLLRTFEENMDGVRTVAFAPGGKQFAVAGTQSLIQIYDLDEGKVVRSFSGHASPVVSLAFSPDGRYLVSGSLGTMRSKEEQSRMPDEPRTLRVWNVATGQETYHFENVRHGIWSVAFAPDSNYVLSGGTYHVKSGEDREYQMRLWYLP